MGTAIKHPVPDRVKPSFVILTSWHLSVRVPGCQKLQMTHRVLYSCTHMATVGVKGLSTGEASICDIIERFGFGALKVLKRLKQ